MTDPTLEELGQMSERNKITAEPVSDGWLDKYIHNPPPPITKEQLEREARARRHFGVDKIRARLPEFLRSVRIDVLEQRIHSPAMLEVARSWAPERGSVALLGDTGKGKSTASGALALRLIREGVRQGGRLWELAQGLRWFRAEELEQEMRAHPLGRGACPAYTSAVNAKLLILDDVGWEKDRKAIASVLAARYESAQLTVLTSGQTVDGLREMYGDAIIRRIVTYRGRPGLMVADFEPSAPKALHPLGHSKNPKPYTEAGDD